MFLSKLFQHLKKNKVQEEKSCVSKELIIRDGVLKKYRGKKSQIEIPQGVTIIGNSAFDRCKKLTSVIIPEGVTRISNEAFEECKNLMHVCIPQTVTSIGEEAFEGCTGLAKIVIPKSVEFISEEAFADFRKNQCIIVEGGINQANKFSKRWRAECKAQIIYKEQTDDINKAL